MPSLPPMTSSHPRLQRRAIARAMRPAVRVATQLLDGIADIRSRGVVVAVSGGPDSSLLVHALATVAARNAMPLHALHINHHLSDFSTELAASAVATCERAGVLCRVVDVTVSSRGEGPEGAARTARWNALEEE